MFVVHPLYEVDVMNFTQAKDTSRSYGRSDWLVFSHTMARTSYIQRNDDAGFVLDQHV